MRLIHALALIALVAAPLTAGTGMADEALNITPPLYREQARAIQQTRQTSDITTTPQPVAASKRAETRRTVELVAEATPARWYRDLMAYMPAHHG